MSDIFFLKNVCRKKESIDIDDREIYWICSLLFIGLYKINLLLDFLSCMYIIVVVVVCFIGRDNF